MNCKVCGTSLAGRCAITKTCLKCSNERNQASQRDDGVGSFENYEKMMTASDCSGTPPETLEILGDGPCNDCNLRRGCARHKTACKTFYDWSELKREDWTDRDDPNRFYYVKMFPRDNSVGEMKTIRDRLIYILKVCCNGHGLKSADVYVVSRRMGFGLQSRQVMTNLNVMVGQGLIKRVNGEFYPLEVK
jgi:hypothetical protein